MSSRPFAAKYYGRCAADCDEPRIEPGDQCVMTDGGELVHHGCDDDQVNHTARRPEPSKCPGCNLFHSGECF